MKVPLALPHDSLKAQKLSGSAKNNNNLEVNLKFGKWNPENFFVRDYLEASCKASKKKKRHLCVGFVFNSERKPCSKPSQAKRERNVSG